MAGRTGKDGFQKHKTNERPSFPGSTPGTRINGQPAIAGRPLICPVAAAMVVLISVAYPMTLVLMFIGLRAQWCEGGKKCAERKRGQNNFSNFHFWFLRS